MLFIAALSMAFKVTQSLYMNNFYEKMPISVNTSTHYYYNSTTYGFCLTSLFFKDHCKLDQVSKGSHRIFGDCGCQMWLYRTDVPNQQCQRTEEIAKH